MQTRRSSAPWDRDPPVEAGSQPSVIDRGELCRRLLVVLARSQQAMGAGSDPGLAQFHRCVLAALFTLECEVPWAQDDQEQIRAWAEQPDEYAEGQVVQDLLWCGLAGIALRRLQPSLIVYRWLCAALQDATDVHLVWGVALLRERRMSEARACLAHCDDRDELVQALVAASMLQKTPVEAVQRLRKVQAACTQPPLRDLLRDILQTLDDGQAAAGAAEHDVVARMVAEV